MSIRFRNWLEGIEEYEPYRDLISAYGSKRTFAFDKWFPQERIYIPFNEYESSGEEAKFKKKLSDLLNDEGYELVDLKQGYARQKGKKNLYRIGKLLDTLEYKGKKEIEEKLKKGEISQITASNQINSNKGFYSHIRNQFQKLPTRAKGEFVVVISKNVHDIGSMSTGRGWTSCMDLSGEEKRGDVFKEIENGGFVAYLVKEDDLNIEHPISRIHIRRFDNKSGVSMAVPEESVYGQDMPGFLDVVENWIYSKQGPILPGVYCRKGGRWSDTFSQTRKTIFGPEPNDVEKITKWIKIWLNGDDNVKLKYLEFFFKAITAFFQSNEKFSNKFLQKLKNFIFSDSIFKTSSSSQKAAQFQAAFALKYPEMINKKDFESAFQYAAEKQEQMVEKLIQKFPDYITKELLDSVKNSYAKKEIVKEKPEFKKYLHDQISDEIMREFNVENPMMQVPDDEFGARYGMRSMWSIVGRISDYLNALHSMIPIPEPLIKKIIEFAEQIDKLKLISNAIHPALKNEATKDAERAKVQIVQMILSAFMLTRSDTPSVQRFYQSLLPKYYEIGGIGHLGYAIGKLGENGRQFLPFIMQKKQDLEDAKSKLPKSSYELKYVDKALESYDYVIDAIKNGTGRSFKYSYDFGTNVEYRLFEKN